MGICRLLGGRIWDGFKFVKNDEKAILINDDKDMTITLHEDDLITPGLIDFHAHLWSPATISPFGVDPSKMYEEGIVGGVDAGSFGGNNWEVADNYWQNDCKMKIKSFMSILPEGLAIFPPTQPTRPEDIDVNHLIESIQSNKKKGRLLGTKVQLGWLPYKDIATDRHLLKIARAVADKTATNIMVHISGQIIDFEETVFYLSAGDVITHIYSGFDNTILTQTGTISDAIQQARKKGVWFDIGHAGKHFSWEIFKTAYNQGVCFDTMGGDITIKSWKNENDFKIYDLFHLVSGFLNYGINIDEVFRAVITNPAAYMKIDMDIDKRCLVLRKKLSRTELTDGLGESVKCQFEYGPRLFVDSGDVILKA